MVKVLVELLGSFIPFWKKAIWIGEAPNHSHLFLGAVLSCIASCSSWMSIFTAISRYYFDILWFLILPQKIKSNDISCHAFAFATHSRKIDFLATRDQSRERLLLGELTYYSVYTALQFVWYIQIFDGYCLKMAPSSSCQENVFYYNVVCSRGWVSVGAVGAPVPTVFLGKSF